MLDLRERLHDLDDLDVPDVLARARAIGPRPPMPDPGPSTGRRIAIVGLALAVGLAAVVLASRVTRSPERVPTGTVPCPPGMWQRPEASSVAGSVGEVADTSPGDIWTLTGGSILHLTGDGWKAFDLPPTRIWGMGESASGEVWVVSRDAAWLLAGRSWAREPFPDGVRYPRAILPFGSDDVWVAGETEGPTPTSQVWHWDGTSWSEIALPPMPAGAAISAMGGTAPNDVWAIGRYTGGVQPMHWDGSGWTTLPQLPVRGKDDEVTKIVASARDEAWLMAGPHLLHWDGTAWTVAPDPLRRTNRWSDLATGPSGTWVVDGAAGPHGRLLRWDGTGWIPAPPTPMDRYLSARGIGESFRLAVVGNEVVVIHGPYRWIHRNPNGSGAMGAGPITAFTYTCGAP